MKKNFLFLAAFLLFLAHPAFALACHPDEHFGFLVATDEGAKTFTIYHLGDRPEMGGRLFSFRADDALLKRLEIGTKIAVRFTADQDRLIAKEVTEFSA